ncbi:hypothetical protein [Chryseobacterium indologenes]
MDKDKIEADLKAYEKYVENFWRSHRFNSPVVRMKTFKEMFGYEVVVK